MGERLLCKQEVVGSIPITSTRHSALDQKPTGRGSGTDFVTGGSFDRRWRLLMDNCEEASCVTEAGNRGRPKGLRVRSRTKCLLRRRVLSHLVSKQLLVKRGFAGAFGEIFDFACRLGAMLLHRIWFLPLGVALKRE